MTCAKTKVEAELILADGSVYHGENWCAKPQETCPRDEAGYSSGQGYHLCKSVCEQPAHAEIDAIQKAQTDGKCVKNATMRVFNIHWICGPCTDATKALGIHAYLDAKE